MDESIHEIWRRLAKSYNSGPNNYVRMAGIENIFYVFGKLLTPSLKVASLQFLWKLFDIHFLIFYKEIVGYMLFLYPSGCITLTPIQYIDSGKFFKFFSRQECVDRMRNTVFCGSFPYR